MDLLNNIEKRIKYETIILNRFFPGKFQFIRKRNSQYKLTISINTNSGKGYLLLLELDDFPNFAPKVYIKYPENLTTYKGKRLSSYSSSHDMHLLSPKNGMPQICHIADWNPNITLYKVIFKVRLWLEAYEKHKKTGKSIDQILTKLQNNLK